VIVHDTHVQILPGPLRPATRLRPGRGHRAGVPAGVRSRGRVAARRPDARPADPHHRRHPHGRERIALPPDPAAGPQRRVPRARRRLRHHARAARSARRRTAEIRRQRLPRAAHPAGDHADPARRGPQRSEPRHRRARRPPPRVNTRAIDLTEALLLLSRADQRSFTRERVDLSLIAEEATETLLPLAEKRGLTIETSGEMTPTIGSRALLLQMTTNLVHNAIVHNLPENRAPCGSRPALTGAHRREHRRAHRREHRRGTERSPTTQRRPRPGSSREPFLTLTRHRLRCPPTTLALVGLGLADIVK
jgi:hypothetical protein